MWIIVLKLFHEESIIFEGGVEPMDKDNKTYSMSIRVSEDELAKLKIGRAHV